MDAQVDLTERSVFDKNSNIRVQKDSEPLISWLCPVESGLVSLEYLRKRSKECAENDRRLVRKIGVNKLYQPYLFYKNSTSTSSTSAYTTLRWNSGQNTWTYNMRPGRTYFSPSNITSNTNTNISVSRSGMDVTYGLSDYENNETYHITYQYTEPVSDAASMEECTKRMLRQTILAEMWGSSYRPFDQVPLKSESMGMLPWKTKKEEPILEDKLFPWEVKRTTNWRHTLELFVDKDNVIPWNPTDKAVTDHDYIEPKDPIRSYTRWMNEILPWMYEMIRDTWRSSISPELVNEYMSSHWYEFTIPEYRERWFHNENKAQPNMIQFLSDSLQNIVINNSTINVFM